MAVSLLGVLIFAGFLISAAESFLKDYPIQYYTSPPLNKLISQTNAKRVFLEDPFYQHFLEFEFARTGRKVIIENQVSCTATCYDFIVIEHSRPFPAGIPDSLYQQVYQDELVKAYAPVNRPEVK
jgi:hypothetical protein